MRKNSFVKWLRVIKKLDDTSIKVRIKDLEKVEADFGNLDSIYEIDGFETILEDIFSNTQMHNDTYKDSMIEKGRKEIYSEINPMIKALNLYEEFLDNEVINSIKSASDITPDEHDGSYELVREAVRSLSRTSFDRLDIVDLELLYFMAVGTWKGGIKFRYEKIRNSNLPIDEKNRIKSIFDRSIQKAKNHEYTNSDSATWSIGMFGTGFYSFKSKSDKENTQKFISLCIDIMEMEDEEKVLDIADERLSNGIKGLQAAAGSIVLHCLKPTVFPIINSGMIEAAVLLESEGVVLNKPKELTHYIENSRYIKKFRDEKCEFKNYRVLDIKLWDVGDLTDTDVIDNDSNGPFYDEIDITKKQWKEMLDDREIFKEGDIDLIRLIYENEGSATATELAVITGKHKSSFNLPVVSLAKRIADYTSCTVPMRSNGKERWWHVPFNGSYMDNGHFNWILRDELMEAFEESIYSVQETNLDYEITGDNTNESVNFWWLNASPKIWEFSQIQVGETVEYISTNNNGNRRRIFKNFEDVREGDMVIGYESYPVKAIVAICKITKPHDGDKIEVQKIENLINPIEYSRLSEIEVLKDMEYFKIPRGSLFKLTKAEYDEIMDLIREETPEPTLKTKISYTKEDFLEEVFMDEDQYDTITGLLKHKKNLILQGAPGVGKTFIAKKLAYSMMNEKNDDRVEMIQFHQSYSYEDFIMGYKPDDVGFKLKNGVFFKFCRKAQNDPDRDYYFIIDEINRGNLSKIFGELLMLIESDKRGAKFSVPLTYNESRFFVPANVHMIGTMNTADRSLAMIDYALRRRFCFVDLPPAFENLNFKGFIENKNPELSEIIMERLNKLNSAIESDPSLGKGFSIGHSYFCTDSDYLSEKDYENIIRYEIVPQLSEYWFDEPEKVKEWETILLG